MGDLLVNYLQFALVYICVCLEKKYFPFFVLFVLLFFFFKDFVGISFANLHKTTLLHLGEPRGLKGLLYMLSATIISMK